MPVIDQILSRVEDTEDYRFIRLEALWIAINLATDCELGVQYMLVSSFPDTQINKNELDEDFKYGKSSLLMKLDILMKQIISQNCEDIKTLNCIF